MARLTAVIETVRSTGAGARVGLLRLGVWQLVLASGIGLFPCSGTAQPILPAPAAQPVPGPALSQPASRRTLAQPAPGQPAPAAAGSSAPFLERVYQDADGQHRYAVWLPRGYSRDRQWPVMLYLHGAGERGTDGLLPTTVGLGAMLKENGANFPFVVAFPQSRGQSGRILTGWVADSPDAQRAMRILDEVEREFNGDRSRTVLSGWSMGGYGAWSLAAAHPERWSAVMPLSGGGEPRWAESLSRVPIWALHGSEDAAVPPQESREMVEAVRAAGGIVNYTEIIGAAHDIAARVYADPTIVEWLQNPRQLEDGGSGLDLSPGPRRSLMSTPDASLPFIPALDIPDAAYVRLGNDVLRSLSYAAPRVVPPEMLAGRLPNMHDSTRALGHTFHVTFAGVSYRGTIDRVQLESTGRNRVNVLIGMRDVVLTLGSTHVRGSWRKAADTGPISIVIGHRRPVWLSLTVSPSVQNRQVRLQQLGMSFRIPDDNWYVTQPAGVSTRGLFMNERRVTNSLMQGLYGSKSRIETEVAAVVPGLIEELERQIQVAQQNELVAGLWPLPVYRPRLRIWPQEIIADAGGISLKLGVTAAAIDPEATPGPVRTFRPAGLASSPVPPEQGLRIGVAGEILEPLMQLIIDAGIGFIDVLDIPGGSFDPLADRRVLAEALPDLSRYNEYVEVRSEFVLVKPLRVDPAEISEGGEDTLHLVLPHTQLHISLRDPTQTLEWTPYAVFDLRLAQQVAVSMVRPNFQARALRLEWRGAADVDAEGRFAPEAQPADPRIDNRRMEELIARSWRNWSGTDPVRQIAIEDLEFASVVFRLADAGWRESRLYAAFGTPRIRLDNAADHSLLYQTKGPYSPWGGPYTLGPGETHEYEVPYSMLYRGEAGTGPQLFTLPLGAHLRYEQTPSGPQLFSVPLRQEQP